MQAEEGQRRCTSWGWPLCSGAVDSRRDALSVAADTRLCRTGCRSDLVRGKLHWDPAVGSEQATRGGQRQGENSADRRGPMVRNPCWAFPSGDGGRNRAVRRGKMKGVCDGECHDAHVWRVVGTISNLRTRETGGPIPQFDEAQWQF